jgi:hypothetical protein
MSSNSTIKQTGLCFLFAQLKYSLAKTTDLSAPGNGIHQEFVSELRKTGGLYYKNIQKTIIVALASDSRQAHHVLLEAIK